MLIYITDINKKAWRE